MRSLRTLAVSLAASAAVVGSLLASAPAAGAADATSTTAGQAAAVPAAAAEAASTGVGTTPAAVSAVDWGPCDDPTLQAFGAVCGTLPVPLDHSRPNGKKIQLALSMLKHTVPDAQYQGIMLVNPGGPGGSGLVLSVLGEFIPKGAGAAYDWIGFDPRGVGASVPSLNCIKDYFAGPRPEYVPFTPALERTWLDRSKAYATACGKNGGELLENMRTTDVARDVDLIRAAMKVPQLNFYGFSYGTYLGQVYATMFPAKVRRMVFDSNVDPTRVFYRANLDQDVAFQRNIEIWWAWVAQNDATYHLGTTRKAVEKAWYAEKEKLRKAPAGGVVGPDEWTDIFLAAGYNQLSWTDLAALWDAWAATRDPAPLVAAYADAASPTDDNGFAVYNAVQCTDAIWPKSWSTWRADNWAVHRKAPFETWANAWFNAPCLFWPAEASPAVDVDGRKVAPILLVGETLDAATPFTGSLEVRKRFPRSSLIALPGGTSHAFSLFGNSCLDDQIADYLATGALPARKPGNGPDATCAPLPVPEASPASASAQRRTAGTDRYELLDRLLHRGRL